MVTASIPQSPVIRKALALIQRLALAVVGGYVLSAEAAAWAALGLRPWLGAAEAVVLTAMLAFVLYLESIPEPQGADVRRLT